MPTLGSHLYCFPRTCGGDPQAVSGIGILGLVFPAPAGVIPAIEIKAEVTVRFPRTCGGDPGRLSSDSEG